MTSAEAASPEHLQQGQSGKGCAGRHGVPAAGALEEGVPGLRATRARVRQAQTSPAKRCQAERFLRGARSGGGEAHTQAPGMPGWVPGRAAGGPDEPPRGATSARGQLELTALHQARHGGSLPVCVCLGAGRCVHR